MQRRSVLSLEVFKVRLDGALSNLAQWKASLPKSGELHDLQSPFHPKPFYDSILLSLQHPILFSCQNSMSVISHHLSYISEHLFFFLKDSSLCRQIINFILILSRISPISHCTCSFLKKHLMVTIHPVYVLKVQVLFSYFLYFCLFVVLTCFNVLSPQMLSRLCHFFPSFLIYQILSLFSWPRTLRDNLFDHVILLHLV